MSWAAWPIRATTERDIVIVVQYVEIYINAGCPVSALRLNILITVLAICKGQDLVDVRRVCLGF